MPQDHHLRFVAQGDSARYHSVRARRSAARAVVLSPGVPDEETNLNLAYHTRTTSWPLTFYIYAVWGRLFGAAFYCGCVLD